MEVILGKSAGFCYGVKRAVEGAKDELKKAKGKTRYCLGEIVHNKQVIKDLQEKGLVFIEDIKEAKGETIIRAHGIKKEIYKLAKKAKMELKDFTCPNVLRIHKIAEEHAKRGYYIYLIGSKNHPENIGTLSFCGDDVTVIETEEDVASAIEKLRKSAIKKLLVILQTTYSVERFKKIEKLIKENIPENVKLVIKNTICHATELRQKETEEIAKKVDYMIIIGGANSSNTKKLYEIGKANCKSCVCVETADELDLSTINKYEKVGVMAGAATPQELIEEVVNLIK